MVVAAAAADPALVAVGHLHSGSRPVQTGGGGGLQSEQDDFNHGMWVGRARGE